MTSALLLRVTGDNARKACSFSPGAGWKFQTVVQAGEQCLGGSKGKKAGDDQIASKSQRLISTRARVFCKATGRIIC